MPLLTLGLGFMTLPMALGSGDGLLAVIIVGLIGTGVVLMNT
jgi:hypothetical protein